MATAHLDGGSCVVAYLKKLVRLDKLEWHDIIWVKFVVEKNQLDLLYEKHYHKLLMVTYLKLGKISYIEWHDLTLVEFVAAYL